MSYCSRSPTCDIHIYQDGIATVVCRRCRLRGGKNWRGPHAKAAGHAKRHARSGHAVPVEVILRLRVEAAVRRSIVREVKRSPDAPTVVSQDTMRWVGLIRPWDLPGVASVELTGWLNKNGLAFVRGGGKKVVKLKVK